MVLYLNISLCLVKLYFMSSLPALKQLPTLERNCEIVFIDGVGPFLRKSEVVHIFQKTCLYIIFTGLSCHITPKSLTMKSLAELNLSGNSLISKSRCYCQSVPEPDAYVLKPHEFLKTESLAKFIVSLSLNESKRVQSTLRPEGIQCIFWSVQITDNFSGQQ